MKNKKCYVLTRNGVYYDNTMFDVIEGYSCARETVKEYQRYEPRQKWDCIEYDPKKHSKDDSQNS